MGGFVRRLLVVVSSWSRAPGTPHVAGRTEKQCQRAAMPAIRTRRSSVAGTSAVRRRSPGFQEHERGYRRHQDSTE
jgi:hypothetical protein